MSRTLIALVATLMLGAMQSPPRTSPLLNPDSPAMNATAPPHFKVRLETTKGDVVLEIQRVWAPQGVDRFFNLVRAGYYNDVRITRVVVPKWAQFGISGDPKTAKIWRNRPILDDPRVLPNERGTIAFAFAVPGGRTTQVFINLRDNRETHDKEPFVPFGRVISGMEAVDSWYADYGENAGSGIRSGKQVPIFEGGAFWGTLSFSRRRRRAGIGQGWNASEWTARSTNTSTSGRLIQARSWTSSQAVCDRGFST